MTSEPTEAFVWIWLPGAEEPVVAGRLQLAGCLQRASTYMLTASDARELIDHQVEVIECEWHEICDLAQMTQVDRSLFWGRQFLNRYAFEGYSAAPVPP